MVIQYNKKSNSTQKLKKKKSQLRPRRPRPRINTKISMHPNSSSFTKQKKIKQKGPNGVKENEYREIEMKKP